MPKKSHESPAHGELNWIGLFFRAFVSQVAKAKRPLHWIQVPSNQLGVKVSDTCRDPTVQQEWKQKGQPRQREDWELISLLVTYTYWMLRETQTHDSCLDLGMNLTFSEIRQEYPLLS